MILIVTSLNKNIGLLVMQSLNIAVTSWMKSWIPILCWTWCNQWDKKILDSELGREIWNHTFLYYYGKKIKVKTSIVKKSLILMISSVSFCTNKQRKSIEVVIGKVKLVKNNISKIYIKNSLKSTHFLRH